MNSIDYWYAMVVEERSFEKNILEAMKREIPCMVSAILERSCNLSCSHCLYTESLSSKGFSESADITDVIVNMLTQVERPFFLHEGRILRKWHMDVFSLIRQKLPEANIGLIDNGTYLRLLGAFREQKIRLNWLDISLDGAETAHNLQRGNQKAYSVAITGLESARLVSDKVTSLMTLTSINYADISATVDMLFSRALVDEFHVTTMTPYLPSNFSIEITEEEFRVAWRQLVNVFQKYPDKIFFKIYRHQDLMKIAKAVGYEKFWKAFTRESDSPEGPAVGVGDGFVEIVIDNVAVRYFPASIVLTETFLIDADGAYRTGGAQQYTLQELRRGVSNQGDAINQYTFTPLTPTSKFAQVYEDSVNYWWKYWGANFLSQEKEAFQIIAKG